MIADFCNSCRSYKPYKSYKSHKSYKPYSLLPLLFLMLFVTACGLTDEPAPHTLGEGDRLPEFSVELSDGTVVTDKTLRGEWALIILFNTSCPDCRRELPDLEEEYRRLAANNLVAPIGGAGRGDEARIRFICVARAEDAASIEAYWEEAGLTMPWSPQLDDRIYRLFADSGIPRSYLITPEGLISALNPALPLSLQFP